MIDETINEIDDLDTPSLLAVSEGLTFRYEVLLANLTSKINAALYILTALTCGAFGSVFLYFVRSESKFNAAAWPFIPSLLVILAFAIAATFRYLLDLKAASREARVALDLQLRAQRRFEADWLEEDIK